MSSANRIESLRSRLADRLENEVRADCAYQILWLVRHLEQYLERWLGFAQTESIGVAATLRGELFYVVLAATNVIGDKMAQLDPTTPFPREEWKQFQNALQWIQKTPERSELKLITETFESFCRKLRK
jgi:hypothetical protein